MVSLGCHIKGAAQPHPDPHDPETMKAGVRKRFAIRTPRGETQLLSKLRLFTQKWLRTNLVPLAPDSDTSVDKWLENTGYPKWRKDELRKKWEAVDNIHRPPKLKKGRNPYFMCKSFQKDECYPEFKHARAINSRSDEFKCAVGPIFKLIETFVYEHPAFIKHIPVAKRPDYIMKMLYQDSAKYMATDYTAFESCFVKELMDACEFELYGYMTQFLPSDPKAGDFMTLIREVLLGMNVCEFKNFTVELEATRMSGEMCTSLGNGFSNLMFMLFMCEEAGCREVRGVVEGDDGLFSMVGSPPTADDFARLGLIIKADMHDNINTASFCGIIFDPEDRVNVTDPRDVLATFGWASGRYAFSPRKHKMLLRCKALSLAYQYPGCPVIQSLAQYALRCTRGVDVRGFLERDTVMDRWQKDQLQEALRDEKNLCKVQRVVPLNTRKLVEQLYGITVENQLAIEAYLDKLTALTPLSHPCIEMCMTVTWQSYSDVYCVEVSVPTSENATYPATNWYVRSDHTKEW